MTNKILYYVGVCVLVVLIKVTPPKQKLICFPTILPDLTIGSGERLNITHVDHGRDEIGVKSAWIAAICLYEGVGGTTTEQLLVRV